MKCPKCNVVLTMSERQGIEIDYCPECRGVWLDRGELDKIIEKSSVASAPSNPGSDTYYEKPRDYDQHKKHKYKKGGFLGDLFDF